MEKTQEGGEVLARAEGGGVVLYYRWQEETQMVETKSDSDWGGSRDDRKSTSGGMVMVGQHCIET